MGPTHSIEVNCQVVFSPPKTSLHYSRVDIIMSVSSEVGRFLANFILLIALSVMMGSVDPKIIQSSMMYLTMFWDGIEIPHRSSSTHVPHDGKSLGIE